MPVIEALPLQFAGQALQVLGDRALYWPAEQLLVIADLHLGKGDAFRAQGIAVPSGGTARDLARLDTLLRQTDAQGLLILGDVLHGGPTHTRWREDWSVFRQHWPQLEVSAVIGNHDRALHGLELQIRLLDSVWHRHGIAFCHDVERQQAPAIGGHVHPVLRIRGETRRVPVFWCRQRRLVLPAFSAFTGGYRVQPQRGDLLFACNGRDVVALPAFTG